jgi:outer membrane protein
MKKIYLVINVILILAVAGLYYLHFSCKKSCKTKPDNCSIKRTFKDSGSSKIAYIDLDSLNEKIAYIRDNRKSLEAEQRSIESEWEAGYQNLEKQKNTFLQHAKTATQSETEAFQNKFIEDQQQIDSKKQMLTQKLNEKSYKFMDDLQKKLKDFLADFNKDQKFDFIFSVGSGLDYILYRDSTLDITNEVISGLNEKLTAQPK